MSNPDKAMEVTENNRINVGLKLCIREQCNYAQDGMCVYWLDVNDNPSPEPFPKYCDSEELDD